MDTIQELEKVMKNQGGYTFTTDKITYSTTQLKGEKQAYVTGYISVPEMDLYNDIVTPEAMKSMLDQINAMSITIDYEHEAWRDDNTILPVAKIVEAKVDDRGLWVKAVLNKYSPKYKALWGSIKDGFINAFSIAFQPLKTVEKKIGDVTVRLIEELKLLNVAFTGAPVNQGAVVTEFGMKSVMLKAIEDSKGVGEQIVVPKRLLTKLEEKAMENTEKIEEAVVEEAVVEESKVEAVEEAKTEEAPVEEAPVEEKATDIKLTETINELKSMIETQQKENAELKSDLKALKESEVFKSPAPIVPEVKSHENVTMLGLIQ